MARQVAKATQKARQEAAKRKKEAAAGTKVVKGTKKTPAKTTFDQSKYRPKGGLGALAKKNKEKKKKKKS